MKCRGFNLKEFEEDEDDNHDHQGYFSSQRFNIHCKVTRVIELLEYFVNNFYYA